MTIIFKSVPMQTFADIDFLDENTRFFGNEVEQINIKKVSTGSRLIIEEAESLKKIKVLTPGITICFSEFPTNTVEIDGPIEEVTIKHNGLDCSIHDRYISNHTLPLQQTWGAIITTDANIISNYDSIIIKNDGEKEICVDHDYMNIAIIGDLSLKSVNINGKRLIESFIIYQADNLQKVRINRRVLSCTLRRCPKINSISGFGDLLRLNPAPPVDNQLSIGGYWNEVPYDYEMLRSTLSIANFESCRTANEIYTCSDMGGIFIRPYNYDNKGGMIQFTSAFHLDIEDVSNGIEVQDFVELIEKNPDDGFNAFDGWCAGKLAWFDLYKAMRVLTALMARGFNSGRIFSLRDRLLRLNNRIPKSASGTVNTGSRGAVYRPLRHEISEFDDWDKPINSIMDFYRLDLEIWLHSDLDNKSISALNDNRITSAASINTFFRVGENGRIRNLLISIFTAASTNGRVEKAESKLSNLIGTIYDDKRIVQDPFLCEFLVYNLNLFEQENRQFANQLVDTISAVKFSPWKKAAILSAVVFITNTSRARIALKRLASDREFTFAESKMINTISLAGNRAFESDNVISPKWPYLSNWKVNKKEMRT